MKLVITKKGGTLVDKRDRSLVSIDGDSCTIVMSEMADSIEQRHQELSFATDIIEKIKSIQALLADSSGDTRVEQPAFKDSDVSAIRSMHEEGEGVKLVVGAEYMNEYGKKLTYSGSGIFFDSIGMALTLSEDALKSLIEL